MSQHRVEVVRINEIQVHPNADRLDIVKVRGWTCCMQKGQFKVGDLAAYIEPDSIVPDSLSTGAAQLVFSDLTPVPIPLAYILSCLPL